MEARRGYVSFEVQRHVKTDETYILSIMGHEDNNGTVSVAFGTIVEGPAEHVVSWENDVRAAAFYGHSMFTMPAAENYWRSGSLYS